MTNKHGKTIKNRIENPRVGGSIPSLGTMNTETPDTTGVGGFLFLNLHAASLWSYKDGLGVSCPVAAQPNNRYLASNTGELSGKYR